MTKQELDAIRERLNGITHKKWSSFAHATSAGKLLLSVIATPAPGQVDFTSIADVSRAENSDFIAHAPTDIAALLDEIARLSEKIEHLENIRRADETYREYMQRTQWEQRYLTFKGLASNNAKENKKLREKIEQLENEAYLSRIRIKNLEDELEGESEAME